MPRGVGKLLCYGSPFVNLDSLMMNGVSIMLVRCEYLVIILILEVVDFSRSMLKVYASAFCTKFNFTLHPNNKIKILTGHVEVLSWEYSEHV